MHGEVRELMRCASLREEGSLKHHRDIHLFSRAFGHSCLFIYTIILSDGMNKYLHQFLLFILFMPLVSFASPLEIVAAENFYGSIAQEIGGDKVHVTSILNSPNTDPHLYNPNVSIAKSISKADVIIYNGLGYDNWIISLLTNRQLGDSIIVAQLVNAKPGDNPHLWYRPSSAIALASQLLVILSGHDPKNQNYYQEQYKKFSGKYEKLQMLIAALQKKYNAVPVAATEPIFDYLADALGLRMLAKDFQLSIMNEAPPSPKQIIEFDQLLQNKKVHLLIYNKQVYDPVTERIKKMATNNNIPILGVTEMMPIETNYLDWMTSMLNQVDTALRSDALWKQ